MKVYGTEICIDCRNFKAIQKMRGFQAEFINITENTDNLKEFLRLRDTKKIFTPVKENSGVGIPLFVNDNGDMTFDINVAFSWIGQPPLKDSEALLYNKP